MADAFDGKASVLVHGKSTTAPESSTNAARVDPSGNFVVTLATQLANERNPGTANQYGVSVGEWDKYIYNARAASTGSSLGALGQAGLTEVMVSTSPCLLGGVVFQGDSTAAKGIMLRDVSSVGSSVAALYIAAGLTTVIGGSTAPIYAAGGVKFTSGMSACGEASGVSCLIYYKTA